MLVLPMGPCTSEIRNAKVDHSVSKFVQLLLMFYQRNFVKVKLKCWKKIAKLVSFLTNILFSLDAMLMF